MPGFNAEVGHQLGRGNAVDRLKGFTDKIREQYREHVSDLEEHWSDASTLDFSFKSFGFKVSGKLDIQDEVVRLNGSLPFAAVPFRGKIEQEIRTQLTSVLT